MLQIQVLPLLVFGGTDDITKIEVQDSFDQDFSIKANLNNWKKYNAVPFPSVALLSDFVQLQVVLDEDGNIDLVTNPEALVLVHLQQENNLCCSMITQKIVYGSQLKLNAPSVVKQRTSAAT